MASAVRSCTATGVTAVSRVTKQGFEKLVRAMDEERAAWVKDTVPGDPSLSSTLAPELCPSRDLFYRSKVGCAA